VMIQAARMVKRGARRTTLRRVRPSTGRADISRFSLRTCSWYHSR
jgi:hypothetical protein